MLIICKDIYVFSCNVHYLYTLKNVDLKEHINFKIYLDEKASER